MPKYRIKEVATTRIHGGEWESPIQPGNDVSTAELLALQLKTRRLHHPQGFVLQVLHRRKGWVDAGPPQIP